MNAFSRGEALVAEAEQILLQRDLVCARHAYDEAERAGADPDACSAGRWDISMLGGSFEDAWRESDAILNRGRADPHRFWHGDAIDNRKVIVRSLHGLGDAVQMFRYAGLLSSRAANVVYEVPPQLVSLARCFKGIEEVVTWGEQAPVAPPHWDVQVEITELPYLFRTTAEQLPIAAQYLALPGSLIDSTARAMGRKDRPRVGLVWSCGEWNRDRSVPLSLLAKLLEDQSVEFWNLQGNGASAEAAEPPLRYEPELSEGLLPLAALIANLDLVITPDTLAAHLAGALGKPTWVMLQYAADWRWMVDREDSPWYPSLHLVRQPTPGDWESVIDMIRWRLAKCFARDAVLS